MCGTLRAIASISSSVTSMPSSCAIAGRCSAAFVEPPMATTTAIAFSNALRVRMSLGRMSSLSSCSTRLPAQRHSSVRSGASAGIEALNGSAMPSASLAQAIVLAVYIPPQEPAPGQAAHSSSFCSDSVICSASTAPTLSNTSCTVTSLPRHWPGMIVPP